MRRLSLKSIKRDGKLYTCQEWIDDYYDKFRSKDYHSIFNGRKVFDPEKGELSLAMVAKELDIAKTTVMYYVNSGRLKTFRKGAYYVVYEHELERFKDMEFRRYEELQQNG